MMNWPQAPPLFASWPWRQYTSVSSYCHDFLLSRTAASGAKRALSSLSCFWRKLKHTVLLSYEPEGRPFAAAVGSMFGYPHIHMWKPGLPGGLRRWDFLRAIGWSLPEWLVTLWKTQDGSERTRLLCFLFQADIIRCASTNREVRNHQNPSGAGTLILDLSAFVTGINHFVLLSPPRLWYFLKYDPTRTKKAGKYPTVCHPKAGP